MPTKLSKSDITQWQYFTYSMADDGHLHVSLGTWLRLPDRLFTYMTPAPSTVNLSEDRDREQFDGSFDYQLIVRKLNFLEKSTRSDIAYTEQQCTRFCSSPRKSHGDAIIHLAKYLRSSYDKGLIFSP